MKARTKKYINMEEKYDKIKELIDVFFTQIEERRLLKFPTLALAETDRYTALPNKLPAMMDEEEAAPFLLSGTFTKVLAAPALVAVKDALVHPS